MQNKFSYAFGLPHRMMLSRPSASEKMLADTYAGELCLSLRWEFQATPSFQTQKLAYTTKRLKNGEK